MKEFRRGEPIGWCCGDTKDMLLDAIAETKPTTIAEIGSFKGMSAYFMCQNSNAHIYCIDHWKGSKEHHKAGMELDKLYETFLDNTAGFKKRITPMRMNSTNGLIRLKGMQVKPNIIFVDGDHSYDGAYNDITDAINLFPKALICGDDYNLSSVAQAVCDVAQDKMTIVTYNGRAWRLK